MPMTGAALSRSWTSASPNCFSSKRWAESAPTTRSPCVIGTQSTWVGIRRSSPTQEASGRRISSGTRSLIVRPCSTSRLK